MLAPYPGSSIIDTLKIDFKPGGFSLDSSERTCTSMAFRVSLLSSTVLIMKDMKELHLGILERKLKRMKAITIYPYFFSLLIVSFLMITYLLCVIGLLTHSLFIIASFHLLYQTSL